MKLLKSIIISSFLIFSPFINYAQDCDLHISIASIDQGENIPNNVNQKLKSRLTRDASASGLIVENVENQFFIGGRFDNSFIDITGGTNKNYVVKTTLTLYMGDALNKNVYSTVSFDLKGVGNSKERAYLRVLSGLKKNNPEYKQFLLTGKDKIISYFNNNYKKILTRVKTEAKQRNYELAFYMATTIPECCVGYEEAQSLAISIYKNQIDYMGQKLLQYAKAAWAANPDKDGAEEAYSYLSQIDPSASCFNESVKLGKQISSVVKANWDFENVQKYKDQIALERQEIDAIRAIGEAYAKNQPKTIIEYNWLW